MARHQPRLPPPLSRMTPKPALLPPQTAFSLAQKLSVGAVLGVALAARLWGMAQIGLCNDELSALSRLNFTSFGDLISLGVLPDGHPAGVQVFLWLWTGLFGDGDVPLRLPFVLASVASVYLVYALGRKLLGHWSGLYAATFWALAEQSVLLGQWARPYSPGFCAVLGAALCALHLAQSEAHRKWLWTFALATLLATAAYTHYFAGLTAGLVWLAAWGIMPAARRMPLASAGVGAALLFAPHLPITFAQMGYGGLQWLGKPEAAFPLHYLGYATMHSQWVWDVVAVGIVAWALGRGSQRAETTPRMVLIIGLISLFLLPIFTGVAFAHLGLGNVLHFNSASFGLPFVALAVAAFFPQREIWRWAFWGLWGVVLAFALLVERNYYNTPQNSDFRLAAEWANQQLGALPRDSTAVLGHSYNPWYLDYYRTRQPQPFVYDCQNLDSIPAFFAAIQNPRHTHLVLTAVHSPASAAQMALIRHYFPEQVSHSGTDFQWHTHLKRGNMRPTVQRVIMADTVPASGLAGEFPAGVTLDPVPAAQRVHLWALLPDSEAVTGVRMVLSLERNGESLAYSAAERDSATAFPSQAGQTLLLVEWAVPPEWQTRMPDGAILKAYIWNTSGKNLHPRQVVCEWWPVRIEQIREN